MLSLRVMAMLFCGQSQKMVWRCLDDVYPTFLLIHTTLCSWNRCRVMISHSWQRYRKKYRLEGRCLCAKSSTTRALSSALHLLLVLGVLGVPCGAGGFAPCWTPCQLQQRGFCACLCQQGPHSYDSQFPLRCNLAFKWAERLSLGFQTKPSFVVLMV